MGRSGTEPGDYPVVMSTVITYEYWGQYVQAGVIERWLISGSMVAHQLGR